MIGDPHAILLGIYRESEFTETLEAKLDYVKKSIRILNKVYILKEHRVEGKHIWHLYEENSDTPLSRETVLNIYTRANFERQSLI